MTRRDRRLVLPLAAAMTAFGAAALLPAGEPTGSPLAGWSSLTLTARKALVFSVSTTLTVSEEGPAGSARPRVLFSTRSVARILGATGFEEETVSRIDREARRPLELLQIRPGEMARRFVFLEGAIRQTTWEPGEGRAGSDYRKWPEVETVERALAFADGTSPSPGEPILDFYSLIYRLAGMDLGPGAGKAQEFVTLYRRRLVRIRVTHGARRSTERNVVNEATGASETLRLRERRIRLEPLGESDDSFRGLLGMRGGSEIWLDEASGALVELDGDAPGLGAVQVTLSSYRR